MVCWPDMLVMGMRYDFGMVRGIVVAEDALLLADVGIRLMHADGISQFGANNLVDVEKGTVPEGNTASEQSIGIVGGQTRDRLLYRANMDVLPKATLHGFKIVVNDQAGTGSPFMN